MQVKKASFLTKLVVVTLLITATVSLLQLQEQIDQAQRDREDLQRRVAAQTQVNADLRDAIDHSGDPDRQAEIARDELGFAAPGEKVIIFTD